MTCIKLHDFILSGSREIPIFMLYRSLMAPSFGYVQKCMRTWRAPSMVTLSCKYIGFRVIIGHALNMNWHIITIIKPVWILVCLPLSFFSKNGGKLR